MLADSIRHIGKIVKTHNIDGRGLLIFEEWCLKKLTKTEWIFIQIDGFPVPFFVSSFQPISNSSAIIKLEDVNNIDQMSKLLKLPVYIEWKGKKPPQDIKILEGYKVIDSSYGEIGNITEVNDFNGNFIAQIQHSDTFILIPLSDEIVIHVDKKNKTINVNLPEGLIEIYLSGE